MNITRSSSGYLYVGTIPFDVYLEGTDITIEEQTKQYVRRPLGTVRFILTRGVLLSCAEISSVTPLVRCSELILMVNGYLRDKK